MSFSPSSARRVVVRLPVKRSILSRMACSTTGASLKLAAFLSTAFVLASMALVGVIFLGSTAAFAQMEGMPPMDPPPMPPMDPPPMDPPPMDPPPMMDMMPPMNPPPMAPPPMMDMMPPMDPPPPPPPPSPMEDPPMEDPPEEDPPMGEGGIDGSGILPPPIPEGTELDPVTTVTIVSDNYKVVTETWFESSIASDLNPDPADTNFSTGAITERTAFGTRVFGYQLVGLDWILVDVSGTAQANSDIDYQWIEKAANPWFEYISSNDLVNENRIYFVSQPAVIAPGAAPVDADWSSAAMFHMLSKFWNSSGTLTRESDLENSSTLPQISWGWVLDYNYLPTGLQLVRTNYSMGFDANGDPIQVTQEEIISGP